MNLSHISMGVCVSVISYRFIGEKSRVGLEDEVSHGKGVETWGQAPRPLLPNLIGRYTFQLIK